MSQISLYGKWLKSTENMSQFSNGLAGIRLITLESVVSTITNRYLIGHQDVVIKAWGTLGRARGMVGPVNLI